MAGAGAALGVMKFRSIVRRLGELERWREKQEKEPAPSSRHDKLSLVKADLSEQALFDLGSLMTEYQVLGARLDYALRRWEHVRNGGDVDDRADKWQGPEQKK